MSDDEDLMTDRRGIKRAHESPQKINSLFEGQALDVGDECSIESDDYPEDWDEHFHNKTAEAETPQLEEEEGDPEIIYPEHKQHHLEKAAFYFTTRDQTSDKANSGLYKVRNARLIYTNEPDTSSSAGRSGRAVCSIDLIKSFFS